LEVSCSWLKAGKDKKRRRPGFPSFKWFRFSSFRSSGGFPEKPGAREKISGARCKTRQNENEAVSMGRGRRDDDMMKGAWRVILFAMWKRDANAE
jgi:hypothetical protein